MATGRSCFSEVIHDLQEQGYKETFRGQAWSKVSAEWVYFDCVLDVDRIIQRYQLAGKVTAHEHRGTHSGAEMGIICNETGEGLMGQHPEVAQFGRRFPLD